MGDDIGAIVVVDVGRGVREHLVARRLEDDFGAVHGPHGVPGPPDDELRVVFYEPGAVVSGGLDVVALTDPAHFAVEVQLHVVVDDHGGGGHLDGLHRLRTEEQRDQIEVREGQVGGEGHVAWVAVEAEWGEHHVGAEEAVEGEAQQRVDSA
jgi:hypothetical protein